MLEVCERASQSEAHAKEAMKALRREFKYVSIDFLSLCTSYKYLRRLPPSLSCRFRPRSDHLMFLHLDMQSPPPSSPRHACVPSR